MAAALRGRMLPVEVTLWAGGSRETYVRLVSKVITGRRIRAA